MKKEESAVSSSTSKVEDREQFMFVAPNVDADRIRILQNMGLTSTNMPIAVNMPFYNYPLELS